MRTVGGSARARRRSELGNRRRRCHRQPPSGWHLRRRFANFQRQRAPAGPPIGVFRANAPRMSRLRLFAIRSVSEHKWTLPAFEGRARYFTCGPRGRRHHFVSSCSSYYTPSYTLCRSSHVRFHYYPFIIVNFVLTLSHSRDQRTRLSRSTQNPCALVSL